MLDEIEQRIDGALGRGPLEMDAGRLKVRFSHGHGERLDPGALRERQCRSDALEACPRSAIHKLAHRVAIQVGQYGQGPVPRGNGLFIDAKVGAGVLRAPTQRAGDRPRLGPPGFLSPDEQRAGNLLNQTLPKQPDGQTLQMPPLLALSILPWTPFCALGKGLGIRTGIEDAYRLTRHIQLHVDDASGNPQISTRLETVRDSAALGTSFGGPEQRAKEVRDDTIV